jgi:hypothetical protein
MPINKLKYIETMEGGLHIEHNFCLHFELRVLRRGSLIPHLKRTKSIHLRKIPAEGRPNLILRICHYPLGSLSGLQCITASKGSPCPHGGPYSLN